MHIYIRPIFWVRFLSPNGFSQAIFGDVMLQIKLLMPFFNGAKIGPDLGPLGT